MVSRIVAMESYVPENIVTNSDLSSIVETSDEWINSRTGISERRISLGENTSDLATRVAEKLMDKANVLPEDIGLIIIATMSPDYLTPSVGCIVQGNIKAVNALAFDINAACSGFVYALSLAEKFMKTGLYKNALVIGAEVLSKIVNWKDRGTCVLFGDGAGGVLISREDLEEDFIIAEDINSNGTSWKSLRGGKAPLRNPFIDDQVDQEDEEDEEEDVCVDSDDLEYYLKMNGLEIFNFATRIVPKSIEKILDNSGENIDNIKYVVPHQANSRIIDIVARKLKLNRDKFYLNLDKHGNTSSASIPIALAEMKAKNLLEPGDKIIVVGFGAGLTWASMIINI